MAFIDFWDYAEAIEISPFNQWCVRVGHMTQEEGCWWEIETRIPETFKKNEKKILELYHIHVKEIMDYTNAEFFWGSFGVHKIAMYNAGCEFITWKAVFDEIKQKKDGGVAQSKAFFMAALTGKADPKLKDEVMRNGAFVVLMLGH